MGGVEVLFGGGGGGKVEMVAGGSMPLGGCGWCQSLTFGGIAGVVVAASVVGMVVA